MLLGALVDVGVPLDVVAGAVDRLDLGVRFRTEQVERASIGALRVHVDAPQELQSLLVDRLTH